MGGGGKGGGGGGVESALRRCVAHFEALVSVEDVFARGVEGDGGLEVGREGKDGGEGDGGRGWLQEVVAVVVEVARGVDVCAGKTQEELVMHTNTHTHITHHTSHITHHTSHITHTCVCVWLFICLSVCLSV